ncbi:MAG: OmpA family protein [Aureispira sp.]
MNYYFALILSLFTYSISAQQATTFKHTIYFDSDQDQLTTEEKDKLYSFVQAHQQEILWINLVGHTDNIGSNAYNLDLSQRRVETIQAELKLLLKEQPLDSLITNFEGEEQPVSTNNDVSSRAANRRVELLLACKERANEPIPLEKEAEIIAQPNPYQPPVEQLEPVNAKQIVRIDGAEFIYEGVAGGYNPQLIRTGAQAYSTGLTTYTSNGVPLRSEGMLRVTPCGADGRKALDEPVTVRIPIEEGNTGQPDLFTIDNEGNWETARISLTTEVSQGQRFYVVTVPDCGWLNLDRKLSDTVKIEVKPVHQAKLAKANFVNNRPNYNYNLAFNKKKVEGTIHKPPTELLNPQLAHLYYQIKEGGQEKLYKIRLSNLKASRKERYYPTINNKRVSWLASLFRKTKKQLYIHYKVTNKDLAALDPVILNKK